MAPRPRLSAGLQPLLSSAPYVCPSCQFQRHIRVATPPRAWSSNRLVHSSQSATPRHLPQPRHPSRLSRANATTLASSTAINAPSHTPIKFKEIHVKLAKLQEDAAGYVDLSTLQLALKGLETERTTARVALLTLDDNASIAARRLARVLLSDALGAEQEWEKELSSMDTQRSVLLRYGQPGDLTGGSGLTHTISIPSTFLRDNHVEILIAPLQMNASISGETESAEDALMVPAIPIPAPGGRLSFVRSPVHKAIIVGSGIAGAASLGRLRLPEGSARITALIDSTLAAPLNSQSNITIIDSTMASEALDNFRLDNANGGSFGKAWTASSVASAANILLPADPERRSVGVDYASSVLDATEHALDTEERAQPVSTESTVEENNQAEMQSVISQWSAEAHRDLRDNLLVALESRAWRRTIWWRLLWRIDDVSYSTTDIINNCWLIEAEQMLAYLSGRIRQSGLATDEELKETAVTPNDWTKDLKEGMERNETDTTSESLRVSDLVPMPTMLSRVQQQSGINPLFDPPWPHTISLARQAMLHNDIPAMHRRAQALLLTTYSTLGGSAALGGWLWVASGGIALYESGAIFALGLVWGLRRLQRRWGKERDLFAATAQENGRKVLAEIETHLRKLVQDAKTAVVQEEDRAHVARARAAIEDCRRAIEDVSNGAATPALEKPS